MFQQESGLDQTLVLWQPTKLDKISPMQYAIRLKDFFKDLYPTFVNADKICPVITPLCGEVACGVGMRHILCFIVFLEWESRHEVPMLPF